MTPVESSMILSNSQAQANVDVECQLCKANIEQTFENLSHVVENFLTVFKESLNCFSQTIHRNHSLTPSLDYIENNCLIDNPTSTSLRKNLLSLTKVEDKSDNVNYFAINSTIENHVDIIDDNQSSIDNVEDVIYPEIPVLKLESIIKSGDYTAEVSTTTAVEMYDNVNNNTVVDDSPVAFASSSQQLRYTGTQPSSSLLLFHCNLCYQNFNSSLQLNQHLIDHTKPSSSQSQQQSAEFKCCICDRVYRNQLHLKLHIQSKHNEEGVEEYMKYKCQICGILVEDINAFDEHLWLHFAENPQNSSTTIDGNKIRLTAAKAGLKSTRLPDVRKSSHKISCSFDKKEEFRCSLCYKVYKTSSKLRFHKRLHHNQEEFKCEICDRIYLRQNDLKSHLSSVHSIEML